MEYDLFISYSRKDNANGRVTELKQQIEADYRAFAKEDLRCFFDLSDIQVMDDWRNRILGGLRESKLLLLVLSPAYLLSPYCEWEIVEFLKYENSRAVQGQGVAEVYFVEIPGLDSPGFEQQAAAWLVRVRQRNHVDLRPWYDAGADALKRADVRARLNDLERSLIDRLSRLRRITHAPGNLPAHNPRFVGREVEMERLHKAAGLGQYGILTAVQGIGGMGKTALAIQYAYAYADFYPGGRWMIGCAGRTGLASAIRSLDSDLGIQFTDEEKLDDGRAARRVLAVLQERAERGARARAGEANPPAPAALLILDNVDAPALLRPPDTDLISGRNWLHVIATTRLDPDKIGMDTERHCHLAVDELPEDDALCLIERHQPQGRFPNEGERAAAREIVRLLRGFTLAVEVVAVHLGERKGRVACTDLLERLRREGVDDIGRQTASAVNHVEKLISATLAPTLETLNAAEIRTITAASLFPPDSVPLPWLRKVVAHAYPELGKDAEPGYENPWLTLVNHLIGLRLLQVSGWDADSRTPRICRIHRVVQSVARQRAGDDLSAIDACLVDVVVARAGFLEEGWLSWDNRWEIPPLATFAAHTLDTGYVKASWLANSVATCLLKLGDYTAAEPLYRRALEASERVSGPEHPDTLTCVNNLACLLSDKGDYASAEPLCRRALEACGRVLGPEHSVTLGIVNNLASLLRRKGNYPAAEPLYRRVLEVRERVLGPEHPDTLTSVDNLAGLLESKGNSTAAEPLYRRALEVEERVLGPDHPDTLTSVNNLALLLSRKGNYEAAEPLCRRALEVRELVLGPEHPDTLASVNNLAALLYRKGDYTAAEPLYRRALEVRERVSGPEHPDTLISVGNLAKLFQATNRLTEAELLMRRALEARERVLGPDHPDTLASVNDLAALLYGKGDYTAAEPLYRRALEARERVLGPDHPDTLASVNDLAALLYGKGDYTAAEPLYRRALEVEERVLGLDHPDTLTNVNNLAALLYRKGDYAAAEPLFRQALEVRDRVLGPEHPDTLTSVNNMAGLLDAKGDYAASEPLYRRALETWERVVGPEHPDTLMTANNLAALLWATNRLSEAEPLMRQRLEMFLKFSRATGQAHPSLEVAVNRYAGLLQAMGRSETEITAIIRQMAPELFRDKNAEDQGPELTTSR